MVSGVDLRRTTTANVAALTCCGGSDARRSRGSEAVLAELSPLVDGVDGGDGGDGCVGVGGGGTVPADGDGAGESSMVAGY